MKPNIDDALFNSQNRFLKNNRIEKRIKDASFANEYCDLISLFFGKNVTTLFNGQKLRIRGDKPPIAFDFVFNALNGTTFSNMPFIVVLDQCADFLDSYNALVQDRSNFVSRYNFVDNTNYLIDLFAYLLDFRNQFSPLIPQLIVQDGEIILAFESYAANLVNSNIENTKAYKFLKELFLNDNSNRHLANEFNIESKGKVIIIKKRIYQVKHNTREKNIISYIRAKGEASAQEIADYFDITKRTVNYIIRELINRKIVERIGSPNEPNVKYRVIDNYFL